MNANLDIRGGQTGLDRSVLEKIGGPLEHLLRNAKLISEASRTKSITVVISHQPESFVGSLGNVRIMKLNEYWRNSIS